MNQKLKQYLPYAIIALLILLLVLNKCASNKQDQQNISSAVSQNQIENLQSALAVLENKETAYRLTQDSLLSINASLNKQLITNRGKLAQIALNYEIERQKVKELPNDSAAALFLDRADCYEFPVMQYDSNYLIPIEPIRFYNTLAIDFDEQVAVNGNLMKENKIYMLQVKNLNRIIDNKETRINDLNEIVKNHKLIEIEKDKQIQAEHKKYKQQRVKTFLTGAGGLIMFGAALAL
mgnify:CR=1 FL=1